MTDTEKAEWLTQQRWLAEQMRPMTAEEMGRLYGDKLRGMTVEERERVWPTRGVVEPVAPESE